MDAGSVKAQLEELGATIEVNEQGEIDSVSLMNAQITDTGLVHIEGLTSLQTLNLWYTQITEAGLAHLAGLTDLQWLYLSGTQVTDAGVAKLKEALPSCQIDH